MVFERTLIDSVDTPYSIYFRMIVVQVTVGNMQKEALIQDLELW